MKQITNYIIEGLRINKNTKVNEYTCYPKDCKELRSIIKERLKKDKNANLNDIDVSNITDMSELFSQLDPYNIDISKWDVSNVTDMYSMFEDCQNFNCDLSNWDVSNVEDMHYMFYGCFSFKGEGLNNWNIKKLEDMSAMFEYCDSLEKIPKWFKDS